MDRSVASVDSLDAERQTPSETCTTRPNPFEADDVSARKRRRTSTSASQSPGEDDRLAQDMSCPNPADIVEEQNIPTTFPKTSPTPSHNDDGTFAPLLQDPLVGQDPSSMLILSLRRLVDEHHSQVPQLGTKSDDPRLGFESSSRHSHDLEHQATAADGDKDIVPPPNHTPTSDLQELIMPPVLFPFRKLDDELHEPVLRFMRYVSTEHNIEITNLKMLLIWMQRTVEFMQISDRSILLLTLQSHRKFWIAFPAIITAITAQRSQIGDSEPIYSAATSILALYSQLTAALVRLDRATLQLALADDSIKEDEALDESETVGIEQTDGLMPWTRTSLASTLLDPLSESQGDTTEWIEEFVCDLGRFVIKKKARIAEFTLVTCILNDCINDACRRMSCELSEMERREAILCVRRSRKTWIVLSSALDMLIEKNISIMSAETASRLIYTLASIFSFVCEHSQVQHDDLHEPDGIDAWFENYNLRYPNLRPELLHKAVPWSWRLDTLVKLIRSGPMHLRVMAVGTICNCLSDIWTQEKQQTDEQALPLIHHIGDILDTDLVDYIIGPSCHPEIISGSANIIGFLVLYDIRTENLIDRLWHSIESSQDQRVADAIASVIVTAVSVFQYGHLAYLCDKFQGIQITDFSQTIRSLWENVIKEMATKAQLNHLPLTSHPFLSTLHVLKGIPVSENGALYAYSELHVATIQRIRELLAYGLETNVRQELYQDCVNDLVSKSKTTLGSLWFLYICIRPAISAELEYLTETHDIVRLIVEELESTVRAAPQPSYCVLFGPANQPRKDLLSQIIHFQPKTITDELGTRLWDILVGPNALNFADRSAAWQMISTVGSNSCFQNLFLQTCFSKYLPRLSAIWFCEGMLNFVKDNVLLCVNNDGAEFDFDDDELVTESGVEHIWRIILLAHDDNIVQSAIMLLVSAVYLDSHAIASCPLSKAQNIHLGLVKRCLRLMQEAANEIQDAAEDGNSDTNSIVVVEPERETLQSKRTFSRALKLLSYFSDAHRSKPRYAAADLRSLMPKNNADIKGELVMLRYQSFDGTENSEAKPLKIGLKNTVACLLATLRDETGFDNYRAYYRGRQFIPTEHEVHKSLEELGMYDGLMLVKKEAAKSNVPPHAKTGCSPVELEMLSRFHEFWQYLGMEESIAAETYQFLVKLPADGELMERIDSAMTLYTDLFAPDQPFRSLYTIFVLNEYVKDAQSSHHSVADTCSAREKTRYPRALERASKLLAEAIDDDSIARNAPNHVKMKLISTLMHTFKRLIDDEAAILPGVDTADEVPGPSACRVLSILDNAIASESENSAPLAVQCITLILKLSHVSNKFWLAVADSPCFPDLLTQICVLGNKKPLREFAVNLIEQAIQNETQVVEMHGRIAKYFWSWALKALATGLCLGENCHELMRLIYVLIQKMHGTYPDSIDLESLSRDLSECLAEHTSTEDIEQVVPWDPVANGLANLLHRCLRLDTSLAQSIPSTTIWVLLKKHLYPDEQNGEDGGLPRIILNPDTRGRLYECVLQHLYAHKSVLDQVMQFLDELVPFYDQDDDPYIYDLPFQFEQSKALRSPAGYVGLQNLSNTCYLNSLITQLYMNVDFRNYLLSFDVEETDSAKALLYQTQKLFVYLKESIRRALEPSAFVGTIKTYEQGPIDIHNQMDVDEFYNLLFDRWEGQLPNAVEKRKFRSIYGGQLVQQIKSKECDHISERLEPFSAIQCDIKGKSTLEDSLQSYVGGETMEGDNKYKCSSCDRHVDAVKRSCLKDVPDNLILHLKRFEFNLHTQQRSKIDDYFAFPQKLDMHPYTFEHLSGLSQVDKEDVFELVGVLVHSGTAESGHYYSYVRERSSSDGTPTKWVEFNDDAVGVWDPAFMEESTFGGPDRRSVYDENGMVFDKNYSAYMLFYQRTSSLRQPAYKFAVSSAGTSSQVASDKMLRGHIRAENVVLLRRHCLFDQNHAMFIHRCVYESLKQDIRYQMLLKSSSLSAEEADELGELARGRKLALHTAMSYLDQIFSRTKDTSHGVHFCNMLFDMARTQQDCAWGVLGYFRMRPAVLRALVQRNPDREVRAATVNLFVVSLEKLSKSCPQCYYASASSTSSITSADQDEQMEDHLGTDVKWLPLAVGLLDHLWKYFHSHIRAWDEYFGMILKVAQLGREECAEILAANYLQKCLTIITADRSMELGPNYVRMLQNVYRRFGAQPPSYVGVLGVIDYLMSQLEPQICNDTIVDTTDERLADMSGFFSWRADEVSLLLNHPELESCSLFVARLLEINQAPEITQRILQRIIRAGEQPTRKVYALLEKAIRGDATTEPLDSYIRAASTVVTCCRDLAAAEHLVEHIGRQAGSFQNGEGTAFLDFIRQAMDSERPSEEERAQLRQCALRTIAEWAPYMLQYPDSQVRNGTEQLVEVMLDRAVEEGSASSGERPGVSSSDLALGIGSSCLNFLRDVHVKRKAPIERELAGVVLRVLSNCSLAVEASQTLDDECKQEYAERQQSMLEAITRLVVDRLEEEGSDWEGSGFSSDHMDEDAEGEEALAMMLQQSAYA